MKILLGILVAIAIVYGFWHFVIVIGWGQNYSSGERTGEVYKFSKKGLIWKSWEGSMYLGGAHMSGGSKDVPSSLQLDTFDFTIPEPQETAKADLIAKLNDCADKRKICTIVYKQWFKGPITQDSAYTVEDVKVQTQ